MFISFFLIHSFYIMMHIFIPGWKYYDFLITQLKNFLVLIVSFAASGNYWGFLTTRVREKTYVILQHCLDYCFFLIFNLLNLNFSQTFETTGREIRPACFFSGFPKMDWGSFEAFEKKKMNNCSYFFYNVVYKMLDNSRYLGPL